MKHEQNMVQAFHEAFSHPVAGTPAKMPRDRAENRAKWLREEVDEFLSAETLDQQADAMIDLLYFALGTMVELGLDTAPLFRIVHECNMTKLWPDGKPRFGEDGKVKKPPTWRDPHEALRQEIERQLAEARAER